MMSMTRSLIETLNLHNVEKKIPLKKVTPSKSLLICSMPCEIKAATIRNQTVDSMEAENIEDVSYRFLQARRGENNSFYEAVCWGIYTIIVYEIVYELLCTNPISFLFLLPSALYVPPNISNTLRYGETKKSCEEWLNNRLGEDKFEQIGRLKFNQEGMFKLASFLKHEKIDSTSVEAKGKKEDRWFQCWNMDR